MTFWQRRAQNKASEDRRKGSRQGRAIVEFMRKQREQRSGFMKFRKKPIVIEAVQFLGNYVEGICHCSDSDKTHCHTLEGVLNISHGDWIIKGINGEFYPCKPDIFEKTYEKVE